ncbi:MULTISPECIES: cupin domain-containing protein [unclassified Frankia]|uniref:cupin domain-containing protein n=1 Tax=unclassified Frankia TaxID=2632575 RepID=UPI002AD2CB08|nr:MULTISPECIES: cupin domain-containing protein [unclassified Frankia]
MTAERAPAFGPPAFSPPDFGDVDPFHRRLHQITQANLCPDTAQTGGMLRFSAISGTTVGSSTLWMGQVHVAPATASGDHHHGDSETAIYVVSGHPQFVFLDQNLDGEPGPSAGREVRVRTSPGDFIFVPPWIPHREENPDPDIEAIVVIARSTQEAIVVNLAGLQWAGPVLTNGSDVDGCS